jgi:hypothetical protein
MRPRRRAGLIQFPGQYICTPGRNLPNLNVHEKGNAVAKRGRPQGLRSETDLAADKPHGTRIKYMGGCKCVPCRAANSRYETERAAARKAGLSNGIVSSKKARRHILMLAGIGVGYKAVADACDVGKTIVLTIRTGERQRIRQETERRILSVTKDACADGALVDADPTWKRIAELQDEGFTKSELARRLGYRSRGLQFKHTEVLASTASKIERFYVQIME